jgi:hypothetical protein
MTLEMTLRRFAASATSLQSEADHMAHDVPVAEAARYFQRRRYAIEEQLRHLTAMHHQLVELTKESDA